MTPLFGTAPSTTFTFRCSGWVDPDLPLSYEYGHTYKGLVSSFYVGKNPEVSAVMPVGNEKENFTILLDLRVKDKFGAKSSIAVAIRVGYIHSCHVRHTVLIESAAPVSTVSIFIDAKMYFWGIFLHGSILAFLATASNIITPLFIPRHRFNLSEIVLHKVLTSEWKT